MRSRTLTTLAALVPVGLAALAGCGSGGASAGGGTNEQGQTSVAVGITPVLNAAPLYLGIKQGFFEDEGLAVTPRVIQAAATAIPSMLNGELQFALVSSVPVITARGQGLPVAAAVGNDVYVDTPDQDAAAVLVAADSPIQKTGDFSGTTIAVVGLRSAPELATRLALQEAGVDPGTVEFVEVPYPEMISAVADGRVDGALVVDPFLQQGLAQGLRAASYPFSEALPRVTGLTWVGVLPYLQANQETATAFARAMTRSVEYAAAHPDEARAVAAEFTQLTPEALTAVHLPAYEAELDPQVFRRIAEHMTAQGFLQGTPDVENLVWQP
jgi:NitT/TauT family transport system substrate-binding protein